MTPLDESERRFVAALSREMPEQDARKLARQITDIIRKALAPLEARLAALEAQLEARDVMDRVKAATGRAD